MLSDDDGVAVVVDHSPRGQAPVLQVCLWTSNNSEDKSLLSPTPGHQIHPVTPLSYTWPPNSPSHSYLLQLIIKFTKSLPSPTNDHQVHHVTPISCISSSKFTMSLLSPKTDHQSSPSHSNSFTCILKPTRKMTVWRSM